MSCKMFMCVCLVCLSVFRSVGRSDYLRHGLRRSLSNLSPSSKLNKIVHIRIRIHISIYQSDCLSIKYGIYTEYLAPIGMVYVCWLCDLKHINSILNCSNQQLLERPISAIGHMQYGTVHPGSDKMKSIMNGIRPLHWAIYMLKSFGWNYFK